MIALRHIQKQFARTVVTILSLAGLWLALSLPVRAIEIQEVVSPSGVKAWLVEDYTVPLVSLSMEFRAGTVRDPEGREGLSSILAAMMDEGAGELDAAALKAEIEDRGFELGFSSGLDDFSGGMRMLAIDKKRGFDLMRKVLTEPRFEARSLERIREAYVAAAERRQKDPDAILGNRLRSLMFADHPYGRSSRGSAESLARITREDVIAHHRNMMARDNLYIGVVGAISPQELSGFLESAFSRLPETSSLPKIDEVTPAFGIREHIQFDGPQAIISIALPGLKRDHPDFFAAHIMNHILGGGSFSSWLYNEVREKRGLVYGIGSGLRTLNKTAYLAGGFSTRPDQADEALAITLEQIRRMAGEGPSKAELEAAKKFVFGTYAISNLDTSRKIANVLVGLQTARLGRDYIDRRGAIIDAVTLEDVKRVAKELLSKSPTIVTLGPGDV